MPMNLNICVTDEEIEHDLTGLQTKDPLQCVGAQSGHCVIGPHGISQCIYRFVPKSAWNHVGTNETIISDCCPTLICCRFKEFL